MLVAGLVSILALYPRGQLHPRADPHQEGRAAGLQARLEPDRRHPAAGPVVHVRGRPQPAPRQDLLRHGRRSRISAAGADEAVDAAGVPGRRAAGAGRACCSASPCWRRCRCSSRRCATLVVERYSGLQINPRFRRKPAEGEFARQWRWQETAASALGDRADRRWSRPASSRCARSSSSSASTSGDDAAQPGAHPGRASVGE